MNLTDVVITKVTLQSYIHAYVNFCFPVVQRNQSELFTHIVTFFVVPSNAQCNLILGLWWLLIVCVDCGVFLAEACCPVTVKSFHPTATCIMSASLSQNLDSVKDSSVAQAQWTPQNWIQKLPKLQEMQNMSIQDGSQIQGIRCHLRQQKLH